MEKPELLEVNPSVLLTWHEKVRFVLPLSSLSLPLSLSRSLDADSFLPSVRTQLTEVAGVGCIVRVMTDRRTI